MTAMQHFLPKKRIASPPSPSQQEETLALPWQQNLQALRRLQSLPLLPSKVQTIVSDHKLDNYDAKWRAVLRLAKARAHIYLLTQDAFPSTKKFTQEVVECIYEACMELSACGKIPPIQFEPREEIPEIYVKKVYEDQSTFRGDIKRAGATIAENMLIRPAIDNVPRAEYKTKIKAAVKTLRSHSAFLHAVDTRGELVNFASPCLEHFITSYLFKDNRRLGNRFPADFEEIPITTIALFGAVLRNNIDEWKHGKYALREFTTARYLHVYKEIKKSAEEVAADPVHGHAFAELCRSWGGGSGLGWNSSDDDSDNDSIGVNLSFISQSIEHGTWPAIALHVSSSTDT
ncbi:hypothetical protein DENSPDRAFT_884606 [Dentipellis sp. KUC8613]|nr:hypothetical protein DENSPDRAFT_884606 [Dentipellis sp. KUC8613]